MCSDISLWFNGHSPAINDVCEHLWRLLSSMYFPRIVSVQIFFPLKLDYFLPIIKSILYFLIFILSSEPISTCFVTFSLITLFSFFNVVFGKASVLVLMMLDLSTCLHGSVFVLCK